jgi:hypothetical protein
MPGIRQFVRTGIIFEHLLIVMAMIFLSMMLQKISIRSLRVIALIVASLVLILDYNPSSRRVIWDYSNRFEEVRNILNEMPEKGLYVPNGVASFPTVGLHGLADVFNAPMFVNHLNLYPYAARGPAELAKFLSDQKVEFVFARLDDQNKPYMTGYIQDAARFTTYFDERFFTPVSRVVELQDKYDYGKITESWNGRLLRVRNPSRVSDDLPQLNLAQFVSSPPLEVRDSNQNRFYNKIDWSVSKQISLRPESFVVRELNSFEKVSFRLHLRLVSPLMQDPNFLTPYLIRVGSVKKQIELANNSEMIRIDVPPNAAVLIENLGDCHTVSSGNMDWGSLNQREVCFGIGDFWVEEVINK